jgi:hypothetical protein
MTASRPVKDALLTGVIATLVRARNIRQQGQVNADNGLLWSCATDGIIDKPTMPGRFSIKL